MGRGVVETGLGRTERLELEQRTSDPTSTKEGEAWLRTELSPATDQIATLRVDNGGGTWDVPIFDDAASTTNVEKVLRVRVGGVTGFVPTTSSGGAFSDLRLQHSGTTLQWHDSLEASVIPDSGVSRWEFEQDVTDSWGDNDGTDNTSAGYTTDSAVGTYAKSFDGLDDVVFIPDIGIFGGNSFTFSAWVQPASTKDQRFVISVQGERDWKFGGTSGGSFIFETFNGSSTFTVSGTYSTGSYQHFVGVYDSSSGMTLYKDGSSVDSNGFTGTADSSNSGSRANGIGAESAAFGDYFDGDIDDPRIYDKALSASEVSNLNSTGSI